MANNEDPEIGLSLVNLRQGAAVELWDKALEDVLRNIFDPNTKATVTRTITLKVTFKPSDSREVNNVDIDISRKLAEPKGVSTVVYIGKRGHLMQAAEHNPRQPELPMGNVSDISEGGKKK